MMKKRLAVSGLILCGMTGWELTFYPKRLPELTKEYSGEDF